MTAVITPDLEHPSEAFAHYRHDGVPVVVCQEKHMGSRAVVVALRTPEVAVRRFGLDAGAAGIVLTRTGRRFFDDPDVEAAILERINKALEASGLWNELTTDWVVLDTELMPWNAKAQGLVREQYAPTGAAGSADLAATEAAFASARARGVDVDGQDERSASRRSEIEAYIAGYRRYCWTTTGVEGLKLAPFHLLASEGRTFLGRDHAWHMDILARLAAADPESIVSTPWRRVSVFDEAEQAAAIDWWSERTSAGMEGMVVKPLEFVSRGPKGLIQSAVKVRGRDYLRIIYGPEYLLPENLERLRSRALGRKRSLALREFALGAEALERFVRGEPLYRIHECVFAILALEGEPVDPRL